MAKVLLKFLVVPSVDLTIADGTPEHPTNRTVRVLASEFIAYHQEAECTRLDLVGRKTLHVKENPQQIDLLMRSAAQRSSPSR